MASSSFHYALGRKDDSKYPHKLVAEILQIRLDNPDFGYRTVTAELKNRGKRINHKVVLKIMKQNNVLCHAFDRKTRKYNSYRGTVGKLAKNKLKRRFNTNRPYQKVVTDVTELRWGTSSTNERAYFTAFVDLFSNEILSWNFGLSPNVDFVTTPLKDLIKSKPQLPYKMLIHSDQGFQYQNRSYVSKLKENHIIQSMSRKATCLDNAVVESFFHILKVGTVHNNHYASYEELKIGITKYVDYYNNKRIRTKLAGKTPVQYRDLSNQFSA